MPSPIKPSSVCGTIPSATSSLCDRIQRVFLQLPRLLCDFFTWMLNEDGSLTDNFIREVAAFPVGVVMPRLSSTVPFGWLVCNGAEVSRVTYSQLFAVIGTTYGPGNGTTTFNLPNLQDHFLMGASNTVNVGDFGGENRHVLTIAELPAHTHPFTPEVSGDATPSSLTRITAGNANQTFGDGSYATDSTGNDIAHENRPAFCAVTWLIRY